MRAWVRAVSVWGPGLEGWAASAPILAGGGHVPRASPPPAPALLPANERRRTGPVVRLALAVATEAAGASGLDPVTLRSVFGSANGDGPVVGGILDALVGGGARAVSPTQFSNSVHNAAAGYWSIATGGAQPANCVGAGDATWAATLLTAVVEVRTLQVPVLLVVYDYPLPPPLDVTRPILAPFAAAFVLAPAGPGQATLDVAYVPGVAAPDEPDDLALAELARGNPAAQSLRLLQCLARRTDDDCPAAYGLGHVTVRVGHD